MNKTYTLNEAINRMERYCAYQERCHKEVRSKLREMRMIPEAIDHIIHHLLQHNFLNETRFAQSYARGKFRTKKWGRNRIVRELKLRDISQYNIKTALKEIPENEYLNALDMLVSKRMQQLSDHSLSLQQRRKKLGDYLFYRGWEPHLVWEKVNAIN